MVLSDRFPESVRGEGLTQSRLLGHWLFPSPHCRACLYLPAISFSSPPTHKDNAHKDTTQRHNTETQHKGTAQKHNTKAQHKGTHPKRSQPCFWETTSWTYNSNTLITVPLQGTIWNKSYGIEGIDENELSEPGGQGISLRKQELERDSLQDRKDFGFAQGCGGRELFEGFLLFLPFLHCSIYFFDSRRGHSSIH